MKIAAFAIAALLTGCATQQLNTGLQQLVGDDIQQAFKHLGYPDGQRDIAGQTIYIWSTNRNVALPMTTTTTTTGAVGATPYYGTTNSTAFVPMNFQCTVQIAVNANGTIQTFQWEGNEPGCRRYASGFH